MPFERRAVVAAARKMDVVVAARVPPYLYAALASRPGLLVADLYNPAEVEQADDDGGIAGRFKLASIRAHDTLQLGFADVVLCAVEAQRRQYAARIGRLAARRGRQPLLRVVPFGIDNDPPPPSTRHPIRDRFESIAPDDVVVLWWGNVWRWFDAETAIRAFVEVARENPKAKLVFTGGRPPRSEASQMDHTDAARELAGSLGVLGKTVYFVDDWVPHAERQDYLQEADVGLTLHRDTPEKEVAARGRYMDYLWAQLPCVLGRGDELADRFAASGFAATVPAGDIGRAVTALRRLIDDPRARASASAAAEPLLEVFRWSSAVSPLLEALDQLDRDAPLRATARPQLLAALSAYYACRFAADAAAGLSAKQRNGRQ